MNIAIALASVGQQFQWVHGKKWDIINKVDKDGYIHGEYMIVHCEDCRLKQQQPEQLKSKNHLNQKA